MRGDLLGLVGFGVALRLALLLLSGRRILQPEYYRVHLHGAFSPLDNTGLLLSSLRTNESEYTAFLSRGYADREFSDLIALERYIQENRPETVDELSRIVELDRPFLAAS